MLSLIRCPFSGKLGEIFENYPFLLLIFILISSGVILMNSIRKILFSTAGFFAFVSAGQAADLPSYKAPVAPPPMVHAFSWTGFYVGGIAGYALNSNRIDYKYDAVIPPAIPLYYAPTQTQLDDAVANGNLPGHTGSSSNGVFTGGAEAGYNWQSGAFVFGLETDIASLRRKSFDFAGIAYIDPNTDLQATAWGKSGAEWLGTVRGRVGFAADRALFYVTGGLAYGGVKSATTLAVEGYANNHGVNVDAIWSGEASKTKVGWALGGGMEYALSDNWTIKSEYLHYDLGRISYDLASEIPALSIGTVYSGNIAVDIHARARAAGDIARIGINYKF